MRDTHQRSGGSRGTAVRDVMTSDVVIVSPDLPLTDLMELLITHHIGGAPVVSGSRVVGVVSATDLLGFAAELIGNPQPPGNRDVEVELEPAVGVQALMPEEDDVPNGVGEGWDAFPEFGAWDEIAMQGSAALAEYTVRDVMTSDVKSVSPETGLARAAAMMKRLGVHRLLVMSDGELRGIVSSMDIVATVARGVRAPEMAVVHESDFDSGWTHEPVVPEAG